MAGNTGCEVRQQVTKETSAPVVAQAKTSMGAPSSFARRIMRSVCGESLYQRIRYGVEGFRFRRLVESSTQFRLGRDRRREAVQFWRQYGVRLNTSWHRFYSALNPDVNPLHFLPEDVFSAYIEPALNRMDLALAYADKNSYGLRFPDAATPGILLRRMHGRYLDERYESLSPTSVSSLFETTQGSYMIKPALGTGGGVMVQRLEIDRGDLRLGGQPVAWDQVVQAYGANFVVQERQLQHPALAEFHPASLNTLRVITLRLNDEIYVCSCVFRVGSGGNCTDNVSSGGMGCGVHLGGFLRESALDRKLQRVMRHPVSDKPFSGFEIPGWFEVCALVKRLHHRLPYFDIASWDIAIDPDAEPHLIEVNLQYQEVNGPQCLNGPLFGPHTEEVLAKVFRTPQSARQSR